MATPQENIKTELTKLAIKFKEISAKGGKPADYKEHRKCEPEPCPFKDFK